MLTAKRLLFIFITLSMALFAQNLVLGISIMLDSSPPLPPQSLIRNGSFEQFDKDSKLPESWRFESRDPVQFTLLWLETDQAGVGFSAGVNDQAFSGHKSACIEAKTGIWTGYFRQKVNVPVYLRGRAMLLRAHVRQAAGNAVLRVTPTVKGKIVPGFSEAPVTSRSPEAFPVADGFVPIKHIKGINYEQQWRELSYGFVCPEQADTLIIDLANYFSPGTVMFDEVGLYADKIDLTVYVSGDNVALVEVYDEKGSLIDSADQRQLATGGGHDASVLQPQMKANEVKARPDYRYDKKLTDLSAQQCYRLVITKSDGQKIEKWYPAKPKDSQP